MFLRSGNRNSISGLKIPVWKALLPKLFPIVVPVFAALAYWGQGAVLLLLTAVATPLLFMLLNPDRPNRDTGGRDSLTGLASQVDFKTDLEKILGRVKANGTNTACLTLQPDDFHEIAEKFGEAASEQTLRDIARRLVLALRDSDTVVRIGASRFSVAINDVRHLDLGPVNTIT